MHSVGITLTSNSEIQNEFNELVFIKSVDYHFSNVVQLSNMIITNTDRDWLYDSVIQTKQEMKCEIDVLFLQLKYELAEAKKLLKKKFPIRYKILLIKTILSKPITFMYAWFKMKNTK